MHTTEGGAGAPLLVQGQARHHSPWENLASGRGWHGVWIWGQDRPQRLGDNSVGSAWKALRHPEHAVTLSCRCTGGARGGVDPWTPGHGSFVVAWEISACM